MSNPFKRYVQHFLSFPRSDRNAIIILSTVILVMVVTITILRNIEPVPKSDFLEIEALLDDWAKAKEHIESEQTSVLFDFDPNTVTPEILDSLTIPEFVKRNLLSYRKAGGKFNSRSDVRKIYGMNDSVFSTLEEYIQIKQKEQEVNIKIKNKVIVQPVGTFDPNSATVSELENFGFSKYQANNLVNYRSKGGSFRNPTDIIKIYGIDSSFYFKVEKFVEIDETENIIQVLPEENVIIELNSADSSELIQLNGIGPSYAKRIIKYRNLLNGYYSKEQLKEVYNFPEETYFKIQSNVCVDTLKIVKLRVNFAEFSELLRHPYLDKVQVKAILDRREAEGPFKSIAEFQVLKAFDSETIDKIIPYITCR